MPGYACYADTQKYVYASTAAATAASAHGCCSNTQALVIGHLLTVAVAWVLAAGRADADATDARCANGQPAAAAAEEAGVGTGVVATKPQRASIDSKIAAFIPKAWRGW